MVQLVYLDLV